MPTSVPGVFVSYTSTDESLAMQLAHELRAAGLRPWFMAGERTDDPYPREIVRAMRQCEYFVILFSPSTRSSDGCMTEAEIAKRRRKRRVVVTLDGVGPDDYGDDFEYLLAGMTPIPWSMEATAASVVAEAMSRLRHGETRGDLGSTSTVQRVLVLDGRDQVAALERGLLVLGVGPDDVDTKVVRPFGPGRWGQLSISVKESGAVRRARLVVTRDPSAGDALVRLAMEQLRLDPATAQVRVLDEFGPYSDGDPVHVLVCMADFPDPRLPGGNAAAS